MEKIQVNHQEITTLTLCCDRPLEVREARPFRGFFGQLYRNRPEFHHHGTGGLIYRHPLIQYKTIGGVGRIMGLGTGSFLLQAVEVPNELNLNGLIVQIIETNKTTKVIEFGPSEKEIRYRFLTPWLALNEENFNSYYSMKKYGDKQALLNRILVGNLLSLCKSLGFTVTERLQARVDVKDSEKIGIKRGVELVGFQGGFSVNFELPPLWGIGKQTARGLGVVQIIEE